MRKWMLLATGLLMAVNTGLVIGDIVFGIWADLFRDSLMVASNFVIFLTWIKFR